MNTDKIYAESLAKEYAPKDHSKIIALRKMDRMAKMPAIVFGYSFGIIASLVAGTGMCLAMGVLGGESYILAGVVIGLLGFIGMGVNYPLYRRFLEEGKKKYAFEIMELAREISEQK